jgi:hypothetical protein
VLSLKTDGLTMQRINIYTTRYRPYLVVWAFLSIISVGHGDVIDFEDIPGVGTPSEGLEINTQFLASEGISFSLEDGTSPRIAEVGRPTTAFAPNDTPVVGQGTGSFFLTDDGILSGLTTSPLIVSYTNPVSGASGVVLDMDFDETFTIEARDAGDNVMQSVVIQAGDPNTGNAIATPWVIDRINKDIHSIRFVGTRTAGGFFGLGFDLFNASQGGRIFADGFEGSTTPNRQVDNQ